jgi:hypothetical protein
MALQRDYGGDAPRQSGLRPVEPFVKLRLSVLYLSGLSPVALKLYLIICDKSWQDGWCSLSQEELCRLGECCERTVRAALAELVERGLLASERPNRQQPMVYRPVTAGDIPPASLRRHPATAGAPQSGKKVPHSTEGEPPQSGKNVTPERQKSTPLEPPFFAAHTILVKTGEKTGVKTGPAVATQPAVGQGTAQKRYAKVIDLLRAAGVEYRRSDVDAAAVKSSDASPEEIVACLLALHHGEWGDDFQRSRATVRTVCREYVTLWLNRGHAAPTNGDRRGARRNGGHAFTGQPGAAISTDAVQRSTRWQEREL